MKSGRIASIISDTKPPNVQHAGQGREGSMKQARPLTWEPYPNPVFAGPDVAVAYVPEFRHAYQAQRDPWAPTYIVYLHTTTSDTTLWWESKGHPNIEAAKTAAQADFDARVSALGGAA